MVNRRITNLSYVQKITVVGLFSALGVALSYLEGLVPPLPFMPPGGKIGLSNIAGMFGTISISLGSGIFITIIKSGFVLITRGVVASAMSLAGGIVSTLVVWVMSRGKLMKKLNVGYSSIGVVSAWVHNISQSVVAYFLVGKGILAYLPFMLIVSIPAGFLTGYVLSIVTPLILKVCNKQHMGFI